MANRRWLRPSTIATVIAVAAIALGIADSCQTRAHNRLSVRPYLVVDYSMAARSSETTYIVEVSNEGVGPAVIRDMEVVLPESLGGGTYPDWTDAADALRQAGAVVLAYWNYEGGEALGVQRSRELARVLVPEDAPEGLAAMLADIDVRIDYASIYGEEFSARLR